jgi:hypothetical protein
MARIVEYCGIRTIAGLTWDLLSPYVDPSTGTAQRLYGQFTRALVAPPAAVLLWGDRRAALSDRKMRGYPALSQVVAELLPGDLAERVVLIALAEPDAQLYTTFVLAAGKPVLGEERLLPDAATLRAAVGEIAAMGGIDVLAASPAVDGLEGLGLSRVDLAQTDLDPRTLPVALAGRAPLRSAAGLAGAIATLAIASLFIAGDVKALLVAPKAAETIIPVQVPNWDAFISGCLAVHAEEWPSVPGWRSVSRGCRLSGPGLPATAWRSFQLEGGRNLIISQRVAEMMYKTWPHRVSIEDSTLSTETDIALTWNEVVTEPDPANPPISRQAEDAFVGVERAITQEGGDLDPVVLVASDAQFQDLLGRVDRLQGFWIDSIEQSERGTELRLRNPPKPTLVIGEKQ